MLDHFNLSLRLFVRGFALKSLVRRVGLAKFFLMQLIDCLLAREFIFVRQETLVAVEQSAAGLDHVVVEGELLAVEH